MISLRNATLAVCCLLPLESIAQFVPRLTVGDKSALPRADEAPLWDETVDGYWGENGLGDPAFSIDPLRPDRWIVGNPAPFDVGRVYVFDNMQPGDNLPTDFLSGNGLALPTNEGRSEPQFGAAVDALGGWFAVSAPLGDSMFGQVFIFDPNLNLATTINGRDVGAEWGDGFGKTVRLTHPVIGDPTSGIVIGSESFATVDEWFVPFAFTPTVPEPNTCLLLALGMAGTATLRRRC
ncbi:hypothetical protein MalM25_04400 [Planctomycetes bacterium MalM25]|nr:hypothetical protein MalM25_04400 [Planctomycetes bacterium MalM25]